MSGEPNFSIDFTARVLGTEGPVAVGDALVYDPTYVVNGVAGIWRIASSSNRSAAGGSGADAVALTAYGGSVIGSVAYQASGVLPAEISGLDALAPGSANKMVRTSSSGRLERIDSYTAGDDVVGYARWNGRVALHIGLPWDMIAALAGGGSFATAGTTGDIQVRQDASTLNIVGFWKAVDNAGTLRATYWDADGTTLRGALQVSGGASFPTEAFPSSGLLCFSSALLGITDWPIATVYHTASGTTKTWLSFTSGGPLFGDRSGVLPSQIYGSTIALVAGTSISFAAFGGTITVTTPFYCSDTTSLWRLSGLSGGGASTSGLSLDASPIVTSGGTHLMTAAEAATLRLVVTGTGGTLTAPDRNGNIYFVDATGCSGSVTINDGTAGGVTVAAGKFDIVIHDGTNYESALTNVGGGMTAADKTKLDGMQPEGSAVAVSAMAIDWSAGSVFTKALAAGANTFTFSNASSGRMITVRVTGAASTLTWPTVKWAGGVAPTQTASGTDVYTFVHDGTSIYGSVVQAMA
jgi:hypothetical protein